MFIPKTAAPVHHDKLYESRILYTGEGGGSYLCFVAGGGAHKWSWYGCDLYTGPNHYFCWPPTVNNLLFWTNLLFCHDKMNSVKYTSDWWKMWQLSMLCCGRGAHKQELIWMWSLHKPEHICLLATYCERSVLCRKHCNKTYQDKMNNVKYTLDWFRRMWQLSMFCCRMGCMWKESILIWSLHRPEHMFLLATYCEQSVLHRKHCK